VTPADLELTETVMPMSRHAISWRQLSAIGAILLLGACAQSPQTPPPAVASNPPPTSPGPKAVWYHVYFASNSIALDANGQKVVGDLTAALQRNPDSVATIVGRTDTVGSADYNMHLSHRRADIVRDALIYGGNTPADRVETRWTGENRQKVTTPDQVAEASNRVVDIALH
jgi:OOP family OmpA-OmpF porin